MKRDFGFGRGDEVKVFAEGFDAVKVLGEVDDLSVCNVRLRSYRLG